MKRPFMLERSHSNAEVISQLKKIIHSTTLEPEVLTDANLNAQEIFVPQDILLEIFKNLRRLDVEKMKSVCKYWGQTARHPILGFREAFKYIVYDENFLEESRKCGLDMFEKTATTYLENLKKKGEPVDIKNVIIESQSYLMRNKEKHCLVNKDGELICSVWSESEGKQHQIKPHFSEFNVVSSEQNLYVPKEEEDIEVFKKLFAQTFIPLKDEIILSWKSARYLGFSCKVGDKNFCVPTWELIQEINIYQLEKLILEKSPFLKKNVVTSLVKRDAFKHAFTYTLKLPKPDISSKPKHHFPKISAEFKLKNDIKLFKYQQDAVSWMKGRENSDFTAKYLPLINWPLVRPDIMFSKIGYGYHINDPELDQQIFNITTRSAILADEMGLGKTINCLALMTLNPSIEELSFRYDPKEVFDDKGVEFNDDRHRNYYYVAPKNFQSKYSLYHANTYSRRHYFQGKKKKRKVRFPLKIEYLKVEIIVFLIQKPH